MSAGTRFTKASFVRGEPDPIEYIYVKAVGGLGPQVKGIIGVPRSLEFDKRGWRALYVRAGDRGRHLTRPTLGCARSSGLSTQCSAPPQRRGLDCNERLPRLTMDMMPGDSAWVRRRHVAVCRGGVAFGGAEQGRSASDSGSRPHIVGPRARLRGDAAPPTLDLRVESRRAVRGGDGLSRAYGRSPHFCHGLRRPAFHTQC